MSDNEPVTDDKKKGQKRKAVEKTEKKQKKEKKQKDPNAPKRPQTAYMFFTHSERPKVRSEMPELTFGEIGKELGKRWKDLLEPDRKPFEEMAKRDKERYARERAEWDEALGEEGPAKKQRRTSREEEEEDLD